MNGGSDTLVSLVWFIFFLFYSILLPCVVVQVAMPGTFVVVSGVVRIGSPRQISRIPQQQTFSEHLGVPESKKKWKSLVGNLPT